MKEYVSDKNLIAACGLYCGSCGAYRKEKCPGCKDAVKRSWCPVRNCVRELKISSCAECTHHPDPGTCPLRHTFIARIVGFLMRSDRDASIRRIKEIGPDAYAAEMAEKKETSLKK